MSDSSRPADDPRATIVRKAQREPAFRKALLADPKAAIREALDIEIPDGIQVSVHEESPSHLVLVLPAEKGGELDEAQLSSVSGGAYRLASTRMQRLFSGGYAFSMVSR